MLTSILCMIYNLNTKWTWQGGNMKKEEILEASKKENKNKDIYAAEVEAKSSQIAGISMLILASVYFCFEILTGKGQNPAFYSLIAIYESVLYGYKAIKIKEKRKLSIATSVIWGLLTLMLVLEYFKVI